MAGSNSFSPDDIQRLLQENELLRHEHDRLATELATKAAESRALQQSYDQLAATFDGFCEEMIAAMDVIEARLNATLLVLLHLR